MKKFQITTNHTKSSAIEAERREKLKERLMFISSHREDDVFEMLGSSAQGLSEEEVETSREYYGNNEIIEGKKETLFMRIILLLLILLPQFYLSLRWYQLLQTLFLQSKERRIMSRSLL